MFRIIYILCFFSRIFGAPEIADTFFHRLANVTVQLPPTLKVHVGFDENNSYSLIELEKLVNDARQAELSFFDPEDYYFANWSLSSQERVANKIGVAQEVDATFGKLVEYMLVYQYNYDWLEFKVLSDVVDRLEEEVEHEFIQCEEKGLKNCTILHYQSDVRHLSFAADLHQLIYDSIDVISAETFMSIYEMANDIYAHSELLRNNIPDQVTRFLDIYKEAFLVLEDAVDKIIFGDTPNVKSE